MNRKSTYVLLGAAVLCAFLLILAVGSMNHDPDVRYNYTSEKSTGFVSASTGNYIEPSSGNMFIIVYIRACNDHADSVSTGPLTWAWKIQANGQEYSTSLYTYSHPLHGGADIMRGYSAKFALVFEIPANTATYAIKEQYQWGFESVERDTSIVV